MEAGHSVEAAESQRVDSPDWYELLQEAVNEPGQLSAAHRFFHKYSLANRWLASLQLRKLGLPLMPINTFGTRDKKTGEGLTGWLAVNRHVKKDEKATISLYVPVTIKKKPSAKKAAAIAAGAAEDKEDVFKKFILRSAWFHLGQTDGEEFKPEEVTRGDWQLTGALDFLEIKETPFEFLSVTDKRLGCAVGQEISISPLETHQTYGRLREMARIVLGHTAETPSKSVPTEPALQDLEAETAAYLCAATLGISGLDEARMRLQLNLAKDAKLRIPDKCAHRAFSAADKLINAGYC
ncbi:hypothetical protein [Paraburkholderia sp. A3RO-2L]|jgi:hypothetical protein|uniref:hypothetical protein n=1 Tax=unclassified Paraburkholderia TaxID=2615204 RepID=UPI0032FD0E52|nr:hypothetical protein [Burkholderia vietnamiensis]